MGDYEPDEAYDDDGFYADVKAVEDLFEAGIGVPGCAELHANVGKSVAPGP